jgi:nucleoid-associated protein YgaU
MAVLTTKTRKNLPTGAFALPAERKFPVPDASHAANAKARASQQVAKGNITPAQKAQIDAKANKVLKRGKTKRQIVSDAVSKALSE